MTRKRNQVGRAQASSLSLLLAVALLAAAGSGVETARRVAFAGAGLAYAIVIEGPQSPAAALVQQAGYGLVGIHGSHPSSTNWTNRAMVWASGPHMCVLGLLDLPPPMTVA